MSELCSSFPTDWTQPPPWPRLLDMIQEDDTQIPVLLHGEGSSCWPALQEALQRGLATRIGLEDVLELPDGSPAADNVALIDSARALMTTPR